MKQEFFTQNTAETEQAGFDFAGTLRAGDFVALYGDLGVGKTAFVRGAVRHLAPRARVQSPTYTLVNEYPAAVPVYHFDLYRIDGEDSLCAIGFYDYTESAGICFAEWSEKIVPWLPDSRIEVTIAKTEGDEDRRLITVERKDCHENTCH